MSSNNSARAIILIVAAPGKESKVLKVLSEVEEVKETMILFGEYDLFALLECEDFGALSDIIVNNIRNISGVESTRTLTAAPMYD